MTFNQINIKDHWHQFVWNIQSSNNGDSGSDDFKNDDGDIDDKAGDDEENDHGDTNDHHGDDEKFGDDCGTNEAGDHNDDDGDADDDK